MGYSVKNQNDHPSKNRVWGFFSGGECCAGDFQLQVVEVHQEKKGVGTTIASGRIEHYQYDPFGNITHQKDFDTTGTVHDNPYRFSTKFADDETDLVYYGYRFYNPNLGRWVNRDPIEERGGNNIYRFVFNSPLHFLDILGSISFNPKKLAEVFDLVSKGYNCLDAIKEVLTTPHGTTPEKLTSQDDLSGYGTESIDGESCGGLITSTVNKYCPYKGWFASVDPHTLISHTMDNINGCGVLHVKTFERREYVNCKVEECSCNCLGEGEGIGYKWECEDTGTFNPVRTFEYALWWYKEFQWLW